jgi:hypothetical protein
MLFAIGTGAVPAGGDCAPSAAIDALPSDGALFTLQDYGIPDEVYTFQPRPPHFDLGPLGGPFECFGVKAHVIAFQDGGRFFQVFAMFGPEAPASLRDEVVDSLDSLRIVPLPADQQPAAECRTGEWTSCPEAAWLYQVMLRAQVVHLGHRGTGAILGLADGRSFALWTTPFSPVGEPGRECGPVASHAVCRVGKKLAWRVRDLWVWVGPAASPYESLHTRAALPDRVTGRRLVRATAELPAPSPTG